VIFFPSLIPAIIYFTANALYAASGGPHFR